MYDKLIRISFGKDFSTFVPQTIKFSDIPNVVCAQNVLYSPGQFKDSKRKSANFLGFADFLVFDFDEGWSQEYEDLFNQYVGFKAPTRHHMLEKNDIVCERYRIILLVDKPINLNSKDYKRLYKHIIKDLKIDSDTSCVDCCRFYYSAYQPIENCIRLKGDKLFSWEKYNYKDIKYASLVSNKKEIDTKDFEGIDLSYLDSLNPSKRYPCPICVLEGFDKKGHHLGFNKDEDFPTCFFDEDHSKILRKLYNKYKYGTTKKKIEDIIEMTKEKCTPDLIKIGKRDPKPTNYNQSILDLYNKSLDLIEKDDIVDLDIETFCEEYVAETLEECEARLGSTHKYIKGAYNKKCDEYKNIALDPLLNKIRIITLSGNDAVCPFDMYYATDEQKQRIFNIIRNKFIIGQNLKFDLRSIMNKYGDDVCPKYAYDVMIGSRMIHMALDPEEQQCGHNLEAVSFRFINFKMDKHVEHSWGNDNLEPVQLKYCGMDVKVLRPIFKEQLKQFSQIYGPFDTKNYDIKELEFLGPLVKVHPVLALDMQTMLEMSRLENYGIKTNIPQMEKMIAYYDELIDKTDAELGINCGSSKQCVEFLKKYVDPKLESSSKETLSDYKDNPLVEKITKGKEARTRRGLMVSMSDTNVHPFDRRVHASYNQLLSTGRFSCSGPNMQQIPHAIKNSIYLSSDNGLVYDTDYAAVELRLVSVVSQDKRMLNAYKNNMDLHYTTANLLLEKEIPITAEEKDDAETNPNSRFISKDDRNLAKYFNFGLVYGAGKDTFITLLKKSNPNMTDKDGSDYYDKYFEMYTGIKDMIAHARKLFMMGSNKIVTRWVKLKNESIVRMDKEVSFFDQCQTLIGRRLACDSPNKRINFPVQGSGADAIKLGICKLGYDTRNLKTTHHTINLVHDDTIGECEIQDFNTNSKLFRNALEWSINFVLRRQFFTPVDQDFCILSMFGEEVFLEGATDLDKAKEILLESMKMDYNKLLKAQNENNSKDLLDFTEKLNRENRILKKLENYLKSAETVNLE